MLRQRERIFIMDTDKRLTTPEPFLLLWLPKIEKICT